MCLIWSFSASSKWIPGRITAFEGNVSFKVLLLDGHTHIDHIRSRLVDGPVLTLTDPLLVHPTAEISLPVEPILEPPPPAVNSDLVTSSVSDCSPGRRPLSMPDSLQT